MVMNMNMAMTKMSSKGQIVIPVEMRKDMKEGEQLIILEQDDFLIIKPASKADKNFEGDIVFAKRTEAALKRLEKGEGIEMDFDEFLKEARTW